MPHNDQEQPLSPLSGTPQDVMPSLSDMQQYGMHGLPFTTGPQNGHVSSMDSTPGGQHSMDSTGWPLLPPYPFQNSGQEPLTIDGIHQRLRGISTMASIDTNSGKLNVYLSLHRIQHSPSQHSMSRKKGNRTESSNSTQPADPTRTMCQGCVKSLHPTSAERRGRA